MCSGLIQEGDLIVSIGGASCIGISAQELTALIRGMCVSVCPLERERACERERARDTGGGRERERSFIHNQGVTEGVCVRERERD